MSKKKKIPAATIRGTFKTYRGKKQRDLVGELGNVVDLQLENLLGIEIGGWGTGIRLTVAKGAKISTTAQKDGTTRIFIGGT